MAYRFAALITLLIGSYFLLASTLYDLQVNKGDYYLAKAKGQVAASEGASGKRGAIYFVDKDGKELSAAVEHNFPVIYAVPKKIEDPLEAANSAAPILGVPVENLVKLFSKRNDEYELLVRKADGAVAQEITDLKLKGLFADFAPSRFYPLGTIASQVLGYVGPNSSNNGESGRYGIESLYNDTLAGGKDIKLTIDPNIQREAEKILDDMVVKHGATGGSVIVLEPQTGKVLAMAGDPSFDPNVYSSSPVGNFLNPTLQSVYEPGSIVKVLTMAAGIDSGKITPNTTYTDYGFVKVNKAVLTNYDFEKHGPYGPGTTMTEVIEHSINTGAIFAENRTGNQIFTEYMKKFGLGEKTGIDLPGEVAGNLRGLNPKARQVAFDTASYGQGVAVTPIALINSIAAIANGGVMMRPYINAALAPQTIRRVISSSTAKQVSDMMVAAVDTAKISNIDGYSLAGKTGSAFIPDLVHGGYIDRLIDSYVGFGPTSNPRFVALIRLDSLPVDSLAAQNVVPAFKSLSRYIINYYNIPPDRL